MSRAFRDMGTTTADTMGSTPPVSAVVAANQRVVES